LIYKDFSKATTVTKDQKMPTTDNSTDKKPEKRVCSYCGSENVWLDANARWDGHEWVLLNIFEDAFCEDCDGPTSISDA
jgi:hypothetical protein